MRSKALVFGRQSRSRHESPSMGFKTGHHSWDLGLNLAGSVADEVGAYLSNIPVRQGAVVDEPHKVTSHGISARSPVMGHIPTASFRHRATRSAPKAVPAPHFRATRSPFMGQP